MKRIQDMGQVFHTDGASACLFPSRRLCPLQSLIVEGGLAGNDKTTLSLELYYLPMIEEYRLSAMSEEVRKLFPDNVDLEMSKF